MRPTIMTWDGNIITDHNRSPLQVNVERIENPRRMANGTLRKYTVAKKLSWNCSWEMLPSKNDVAGFQDTVDGGWAGQDIEDFHDATDGAFELVTFDGDGTENTYQVMFTEYSAERTKRSGVDFWRISVTLTEV